MARCEEAAIRWEAKRERALAKVRLPIQVGYCHCGCGTPTRPAEQTRVSDGDVKGRPRIYAKGHAKRVPEACYVEAEDGCWEWLGAKTAAGYGRTTVDGKTVYAHRAFYELRNGPIEDGCEVHHRCENPICVNPDHLESMTRREHRRLHHAR